MHLKTAHPFWQSLTLRGIDLIAIILGARNWPTSYATRAYKNCINMSITSYQFTEQVFYKIACNSVHGGNKIVSNFPPTFCFLPTIFRLSSNSPTYPGFRISWKKWNKLDSRRGEKPAHWQEHLSCRRECCPAQHACEAHKCLRRGLHGHQCPGQSDLGPCTRSYECSEMATAPAHISTPGKTHNHRVRLRRYRNWNAGLRLLGHSVHKMPDVNKEFVSACIWQPANLSFWSSWCAERIALCALRLLFSVSG